MRTVVLVEGESDRVAVATLAARRGRDLATEGVEVLPMGGVTNTRAVVTRLGPRGDGVPLLGLYDAPDERVVRRGLASAGLPETDDAAGLARLGFFGCADDLEDELLRALGVDAAEAVVERAGDLRSLRLLAQMPAQRGWDPDRVLRRFLTSQGGRKARYAALFVDALDLGRVPAPLDALLDRLPPAPTARPAQP